MKKEEKDFSFLESSIDNYLSIQKPTEKERKSCDEITDKYIDNALNKLNIKENSSVIIDAADIALFGRMIANDANLNIEGAAMFSHALCTHKADNEIDFFTAVDDLQNDEESGAGMMGTLEFNSATYYRFAALNLDQLKTNLAAMTPEQRKEVVETFIKATLTAMPSACRRRMPRP